MPLRGRRFLLVVFSALALSLYSGAQQDAGGGLAHRQVTHSLKAGETVEISVGVPSPSQFPRNGRLAAAWTTPGAPEAGFRKILHALDPDLYVVYRAPIAGTYTLEIQPVVDEEPHFNTERWRETGIVAGVKAFPSHTPWPTDAKPALNVSIQTVNFGTSTRGMMVEAEPNNSLEQAQPVRLAPGDGDQTLHITAGADDIEYFDNGRYGESGDDWFRVEFGGSEPRLLTANLWLTDPFVAARLRFYTPDGKEYKEGMNANERVHQQVEEHRTEINRILKPGGIYFLRAEGNSPGYEIELRIRKPAPYDDPREAIRQGMYDHLAQVDAWLLNRPRGASVDRRIRDTGNLLGTNCMSCHTQSGVWGPALPIQLGYRPENAHNFRHMINVMYESLRPTNVLKDAANNTSLAPLDLGDGPAGTRVAGHNVATLERLLPPRKLHSMQQIRTANFVLLSNDPSGINAAGAGSNVGQSVVFNYAGEILRQAWDKTGENRYLAGLEDKAQKILRVQPKYTDDLALRIEFFERMFPKNYVGLKGNSDQAKAFQASVDAKVADDERLLLLSQRADGAWGFKPGEVDPKADPAPTALALSALEARGYKADHPVVANGVKALLAMQDPYGRWNRAALTGFVTTAYVLHALARLYPENARPFDPAEIAPRPGESLSDTIARYRAAAQAFPAVKIDPAGASHANPLVRYWAMLALGNMPAKENAAALIKGLGDPVKMVREAARRALRETLLDDHGWDEVFAAYESGGDLTREGVASALVIKADATLPKTNVDFPRLTTLIGRMMNQDSSPAVRAWAVRAAWQWWIWNPPVREDINRALLARLERPEPNALAENALRYQTHALFIANGHRANGSVDHQYPELANLFESISQRLDGPSSTAQELLVDRIVSIAGTYYNTSGGDGGPGQMGYVTEHSGEIVGKAVLAYLGRAEQAKDMDGIRLSLEAAANAAHEPMQKKVLDYAVNGPEHLRTIAATSVSDPRVISLPGTQEFLEPLIQQIQRGAADADRREQLSKPVIRLFTRARWNIPQTEEQKTIFYNLLIPKLNDEKSVSQWYLAEQLGQTIGSNPDLQTDALLKMMPAAFRNPLEEYFWLPSVKWLLSYDLPVPEVRRPQPASAYAGHALELYVKQLSPQANEKLRAAAIRMLPQTELRKNPQIVAALDALQDDTTVQRYDPRVFDRRLEEIFAQENPSPAWRENFAFFRDYVIPEMHRPNREDEQSCFSCHGVAGRVPSMELRSPDRFGYISPKDAWSNYKILMERVDNDDVEQSKLLRKPLNVQTGEDDGHQGGRRYAPNDRGYEVLKRWVHDAAVLRNKK
ncbi:MAG: hypothetical protein WD696_16315 [Bryobacteraceae bacterium]